MAEQPMPRKWIPIYRREWLPIWRTQLKIVGLVCVPLIVTCALVLFLQTWFFLNSHRGVAGLDQLVKGSVWIGIIILLVTVPICVSLAVFVSYRIVGPMRRLAREFQDIAGGKIGGDFKFRKGDDLVFVAESVKAMQRSLRERVLACRQAVSRVEKAAAGAQDPAIAAALDEIKRQLPEVEEAPAQRA